MLNHLIATIMICLGVANTTPISNCNENHVLTATKKNANITSDYAINVPRQTGSTNVWWNTIPMPNTYYPNSTGRSQTRYDYYNGNSYITILGNAYRQQVWTTAQNQNGVNINPNYVENYNIVQNDLNWNYRARCELTYVFQFTPYNFNVNTQSKLTLTIDIQDWETQANIEWYMYEIYLIRNIYTSVDNEWQNYINQQITEFKAYDIPKDIEDINNGFYYQKNQTLIQVGYNEYTANYTDTIDLNITPDVNNYMVVEYIPCVRPVDMGQDVQEEQMYLCMGGIADANSLAAAVRITGTNIIPDGTYEVVDIPGMMFEIIGMPFAFVSQAFNLTLFPGTPYQINIANLFLSIIAIFVFVWLLLLFIKMKAGG